MYRGICFGCCLFLLCVTCILLRSYHAETVWLLCATVYNRNILATSVLVHGLD